MRAAFFGLLILIQSISASSTQPQTTTAGEVLAADAPRTTVEGNKFIAPAGWRIEVRGRATILSAPEGNSHIALVDVHAKDADSAVAAAWAAYRPDAKWPLKVTNSFPNKDGWSDIRGYTYQTSPNEKRDVSANARRAADTWTVVLYDMDQAVGEKRGGQVALIFSRLLPKGYERETFAGKTAHKLDPKRIAELSRFVESGRQKLGVPGVSIGVIQERQGRLRGRVRRSGDRQRCQKPDAETLYIDRVEHEGAHDADAGEAARRRQADVGDPRNEPVTVVQARRSRHHESRARQASDLRVHRIPAPGLRVAVPIPGRHARSRA